MRRWSWLVVVVLAAGALAWLVWPDPEPAGSEVRRWRPEQVVARADGAALALEADGERRRLVRLAASGDEVLRDLGEDAVLLASATGPILVADRAEVAAVDAGWETTLSAPACPVGWADDDLAVVAVCAEDDVRVYGLSAVDGAVRWSVPLPRAGGLVRVGGTTEVVAVTARKGGTHVIDRRGGRILWHATGSFCTAGPAVLVASGERGDAWLHRVDARGISTVARTAPAARRTLIDCATSESGDLVLVHERIPDETMTLYVGEERTTLATPAPARGGAAQAILRPPDGRYLPLADGRGSQVVVDLTDGRAVARATRSGTGAIPWSYGQLLVYPGLVARVDPAAGGISAAVTLAPGAHPRIGGGRIWVRTGHGYGALDAESLRVERWDGPEAAPTDAQALAEALVLRRPPPAAVADVGQPVRALAFTPGADLLISQGHTRPLRVLERDTTPGEPARARPARLPVARILAIATSPDGARVAVAGDRGPTGNALGKVTSPTLVTWETDGEEPPRRIAGLPPDVSHVGIDDRCVAAVREGGEVLAWALPSGEALPRRHDCRAAEALQPARKGLVGAAFPPLTGPAERLVATHAGGASGASLAGGGLTVGGARWIEPGDAADIVLARFSPDGARLAGYDHAARAVRVWDRSGRERHRFDAWLTVTALAFDANGGHLAIGDEAGLVRVVAIDGDRE